MNNKVKRASLTLSLCLLPMHSPAEEDKNLPSLELLEYLAGWQKQDDEWLDPIEVMRMSQPQAQQKQTEEKADEK